MSLFYKTGANQYGLKMDGSTIGGLMTSEEQLQGSSMWRMPIVVQCE